MPAVWKSETYANRESAEPTGSLEDFLAWAIATYQGRRRLVVLWGHSRGVGMDFVGPSAIQIDEPSGPAPESSPVPTSGPAPDGIPLDTLLKSARRWRGGASRGVGHDIDVLGLDSCYMSSVEYAHAARTRVGFLVAADGAVKRTGWNYRVVLGALGRSPSMSRLAVPEDHRRSRRRRSKAM